MTRVVVNGQTVVGRSRPAPAYAPNGVGGMASGHNSPIPSLPPTAAEIDAANGLGANPGPCPECGRARPPLSNTFATGSRGALATPGREPEDTAEVTYFHNGDYVSGGSDQPRSSR